MNKNDLYIEKAKLIESIVGVNDVNIIKKIQSFLRNSVSYPAAMSVNELKEEVMQSVEDAKNGKGKAHEQLFKEAEEWK
ncbi:hypothetical protein [Parabacteroides sp. Marseille-P3160]|uniref:hypothetical protein n=1 Tax=Parabacteroides sp. Marseille-P3160 TaxID=1917887 RepID=UPI0009BC3769|nr:hypothetical protein [Parabacteroides sp. Marseille-P3160]